MATEEQMHQVGLDVVDALQGKLNQEHGKDTGVGQSSITYRIEGNDVIVSMADYFEYLNYGTPNPTTPEEIMGWVGRKIMPGIIVKGKGKEKTQKKIAENIAKHITKFGPRPYPFVQMMIDEDLPRILADLE